MVHAVWNIWYVKVFVKNKTKQADKLFYKTLATFNNIWLADSIGCNKEKMQHKNTPWGNMATYFKRFQFVPCVEFWKRPIIVYFNPEQDRKAAVINPSGHQKFWKGKCEIIRTRKRKKIKKNKNSECPNASKDQEGFKLGLYKSTMAHRIAHNNSIYTYPRENSIATVWRHIHYVVHAKKAFWGQHNCHWDHWNWDQNSFWIHGEVWHYENYFANKLNIKSDWFRTKLCQKLNMPHKLWSINNE